MNKTAFIIMSLQTICKNLLSLSTYIAVVPVRMSDLSKLFSVDFLTELTSLVTIAEEHGSQVEFFTIFPS